MENKFLVVFLCGAMICFCSAEFTADMVYEILSGKLDVLFFTIKGMRNEINDINEKVETSDRGQNKEQCEEVKALFESLKTEMNDRFENLEVKITKKVDDLVKDRFENLEVEITKKVDDLVKDRFKNLGVEITKKGDDLVKEALVSINHSVDEKLSVIERKRSKESDNLKTNMRKFVASEKVALRKSNDQFENDARKNIKNITDVFEGRIHNVEQIVSLFINRSEVRIIDVENRMLAFENASWNGERGDIGPACQNCQGGIKSEKGDNAGMKGSKGEIGQKGQKGERGYTGETESRKSVYFSVSLSDHKSLRGKNIVKFDKVFSNSGSGYSSSTGIFTAPYSGPYLFLFFVRPGRDIFELAYLQLYVDGRYRAYIIQGNTFGSTDNMAGQAYVEYMSAGDKAWIQTGELKEDAFQVVYSGGSTFTGVLIN